MSNKTSEVVKEVVWTPTKHVGKDLKNSPLWDGCFREDEMTPDIQRSNKKWYVYTIKFDGLVPIQITKTKEINTKK
jgi:hypothetical protein